jgi:hypothetical protein
MALKPAVEWAVWMENSLAEYLVEPKDILKVDCSAAYRVVAKAALWGI